MKTAHCIALTLVIIGALNWGLIGFFGFDLVTSIFHGSMFWLARVIFALVGIAGLWSLQFYHSLGDDSSVHYTGNKQHS